MEPDLSTAWRGRRLGSFVLRRRLAEGGMGAVYLARGPLPGEPPREGWAAVKVAHAHVAREPASARMFVDEARLAARIVHPNVCSVLESGEQDGACYLAMEYLHGESLDVVRARAWCRAAEGDASAPPGLAPAVVARIVADAARGLHAAHELRLPDGRPAGVVHRDVSPQNVLVTYAGRTKVVDFGVARWADRLGERTETGVVKGKLAYIAPEQLAGRPLDRRADVFALGVLLWECTTGQRLFKRDSEAATVRAVLLAPIAPPGLVREGYPPGLEPVVMRALARDVARRYQDAAHLADDLEKWLATTGAPCGEPEVAAAMCTLFGEHAAQRSVELAAEEADPVPEPAATIASPFHGDVDAAVPTVATRGPSAGPALAPRGDAFVGRGRELAALGALFEGGARLVTLVGLGGMGKTRLAVEYLARAAGEGAWATVACDLSEARAAGDVVRAAGEALGVHVDGRGVAQVGRALAARGPLRLLLDNAESAIEETARVAEAWLAAAPALRLLVTSREPLRLAAEGTLELAPLDLAAATPDAHAAAVELLLERARQVRPDFAPDAAALRSLGELARALDGIPLALELAAARLAVLSPSGLLARVVETSSRLDVLTHGRRGTPARHATVRGSLLGSWEQLTPAAQRALAWCAVFRGGFELDDAEGLLGEQALDVILALRERSLLTAETLEGGALRLGMYQTVRAFAEEQLAAAGDARRAAIERHAAYFAGAAERWAEAVDRAGDRAAFDRLARGLENLRAAAQRGADGELGARGPALAVRILAALGTLRRLRGPFHADQPLLDRALVALHAAAEPGDAAVLARGRLARVVMLSDTGEALAACDELAVEARGSGDAGLEGLVLVARSDALRFAGRLRESVDALGAARERMRAAASPAGEARVLTLAGNLLREIGRDDDALAALDDALDAARRAGNPVTEGQALASQAALHLERGRSAQARAALDRALPLLRGLGVLRLEAQAQLFAVLLEHDEGRLDVAVAGYARFAAFARALDARYLESMAECYGALALLELGQLDAARAGLDRALGLLPEGELPRWRAYVLAALGALEHATGRRERAHEAFERAARLLEGKGDHAYEAALGAQRAKFDRAEADRARARGDAAAASAGERRVIRDVASAAALTLRSVDARLALRAATALARGRAGDDVVRHAATTPSETAASPATAKPASAPLRVHPAGDWFDPAGRDGAARVPCLRRGALRRMLAALAGARARNPGRPVPPAELIAAGWPGQKILAHAARHRLHVAISTLRKLGLGDALVGNDEGYLLDPSCPFELAPAD